MAHPARMLPTPKKIVEHLDRSVVGHGRAKRTLAVAAANHCVRLFDVLDRDSATPTLTDASLRHVTIEKSNVLLVGPSGTGKRLLARSLAECLGMPFAVADATSLTEAGYVQTILQKLLLAAGMDVQVAQRGIVYIDEIDKLGGDQVQGSKDKRIDAQLALLKMFDGTVATVPPSADCKMAGETSIHFDTTSVLFICGGTFLGLEDVIGRRLGQEALGFDRQDMGDGANGGGLPYHVLPEDVECFGILPELAHRLSVVATLDALGVEELMRILQEPKDSLIAQYTKLLKYRQARLNFSEGAIRAIAELAHERKMGARGLRAIMQWVLEPVFYDPKTFLTHWVTEESIRGGEIKASGLYDDFDFE